MSHPNCNFYGGLDDPLFTLGHWGPIQYKDVVLPV